MCCSQVARAENRTEIESFPRQRRLRRKEVPGVFDKRKLVLIVQDYAQERSVDVEPAVVPDESQLSEFVHEEIHAGARCADHFGERLLRYFGEHLFGFVFPAIASKQQQSASQPLLAGIKKLIDQILESFPFFRSKVQW